MLSRSCPLKSCKETRLLASMYFSNSLITPDYACRLQSGQLSINKTRIMMEKQNKTTRLRFKSWSLISWPWGSYWHSLVLHSSSVRWKPDHLPHRDVLRLNDTLYAIIFVYQTYKRSKNAYWIWIYAVWDTRFTFLGSQFKKKLKF